MQQSNPAKSRSSVLGLSSDDVARLRCVKCRGALRDVGDAALCDACGRRWAIEQGRVRLFEETEVRGNDRLLRVIYDRLAPLHDPAVAIALPLCGSGTEEAMRRRYLERIDLASLEAHDDGTPVRILEIGIGTGANVRRVRSAVPAGLPVEYWGVDLADGMMDICVRRLRRQGDDQTKILLADAHALPFEDGLFDRVFHIGATNNYRDPDMAIAEMGRVARRGTPIVVVDERLAPNERHTLYHRAMFKLVTFYDWSPRDPVSMLPTDAIDVRDEQIARFFYCMTFRMPRINRAMP